MDILVAMPLVFAVFIGVPVLEVVVFVMVGGRIGLLNVLALILVTGVVGALVASRQGMSVWRDAQVQMAQGAFPGRELAHGAMVLAGAMLLVTPGFVTDVVGFLLMVPVVREAVRRWASRRFTARSGIIDI